MPRPFCICIALAIATLRTLQWSVDARAGDRSEDNERGGLVTTEEPNFVLEIRPAAEWPLHGEQANYGGTVGVEEEVIDNWLELDWADGLRNVGS
jgi:hypothetical protein